MPLNQITKPNHKIFAYISIAISRQIGYVIARFLIVQYTKNTIYQRLFELFVCAERHFLIDLLRRSPLYLYLCNHKQAKNGTT